MRALHAVLLGLVAATGLWGAAQASALSAAFTILQAPSQATRHLDVQQGLLGAGPGLVDATLGGSGLPVRSALSAGFPVGDPRHFNDVNAAGEVLWWLPGSRAAGTVTFDPAYPAIVAIPAGGFDETLFPGGGGSNGIGPGFTAAHLFGTYTAAAAVAAFLGSDDDAWVFVDGQLVADRGGVQGYSLTPFVLAAGVHSIDIFFADRQSVESRLFFAAPGAVFSPVSEPASLGLLGAGLLGLIALRGRRR